jgi:hypothetical protein
MLAVALATLQRAEQSLDPQDNTPSPSRTSPTEC